MDQQAPITGAPAPIDKNGTVAQPSKLMGDKVPLNYEKVSTWYDEVVRNHYFKYSNRCTAGAGADNNKGQPILGQTMCTEQKIQQETKRKQIIDA